MGQELNIIPIKENKGIIPVNLGQVFIQENSYKLIHIIPLTQYQDIITHSDNLLKEAQDKMSDETKNILQNKIKIIQNKILENQNKFNNITPKRIKRGALNFIGSIIKDITGNLDNDDLEDIQNSLAQLATNNNKQIIINQQFAIRLDAIKDNLEENLGHINNTMKIFNDKITSFTETILWDQQIYKLDYVLTNLNFHLDSLLDIITFSKNKIISRHLLNEEEMNYIILKLHEQHVTIPHELAVLNLLTIKGLITTNYELIFLIEIPKFRNESFQLYKIIPIPINNKIIYPKPPTYIISNNQKYTDFYENQCQEIYQIYYCEKSQLQEVQNTCIPAIINQQIATCNYTQISEKEQVIPINDNTIFITPGKQPTEFQSNCSRNTNKIREPSLVTISNCYLNIGHHNIVNNANITFTIKLSELPWNDVKEQNVIPEFNIRKIHNWTLDNINEIHIHNKNQEKHKIIQYGALGIIFPAIIIYIILKLIKWLSPKFQRNSRSNLTGEELCMTIPAEHKRSNETNTTKL